MPWSAGTYTRGYPSWTNDANLNLPISATKFDLEDNDFTTGLNNCITKDGLSVPTSALTWGLGAAQILGLTRGNDGTVFSVSRTGGSNNPSMQMQVTDAGGASLNLTTTQALTVSINGVSILSLTGSSLQGRGPVATGLVDMTPDSSSWGGNIAGPFTASGHTFKWEKQGTQVTIWTDAAATGSATASAVITISGVPASITPSSARIVACSGLEDNGLGTLIGSAQINTNNTITVGPVLGAGTSPNIRSVVSNFTNASTCGILAGWSITYSL